ncbi:hypothetical protein [Candidatus Chloroploca asiatica]|uniref:Addiction module component n=1 Tax=Candidatus Chloroploca asiatica TaxID=1506545 RepID=A0A2H3KGF0_9CHLR|nr:hypothetical protein [Candidatus Chloroploca asiatica]PDV96793.1 hypothetical protein A9Q02_06110 [Candidatus Chloroploca asiatica]
MTLQEMLREIPRLTTREQLLLLEAVSRSLRADLDAYDMQGSAERLLGMIKTDEELTDEDVERIRFEHLTA